MAATISSDSAVKRIISGTGFDCPRLRDWSAQQALWRTHRMAPEKDPQGHPWNAGRHNLRKELPMELTGPVTTIMALASFVFVGAIIFGMI
jgi:hypothetical protein